jgi:hypothetical protein
MSALHRLRAGLWITLAACAAATLLSACGDAGSQSDSIRSGTTSSSVKLETRPPKPMAGRSSNGSKEKRASKNGTTGPTKARTQATALHGQSSTSKQIDLGRCPDQVSRQRCAKLAEVLKHSKTSGTPTVDSSECPPALSESDCKRLAESHRQAASNQPVLPGECPPALTSEQCREVKEAYEKSTR